MSETNDSSAQAGRTGKTLSLKKTETSTVKQSFSHGRTKAVVVEKKRARVAPGGAAPAAAPAAAKTPAAGETPKAEPVPKSAQNAAAARDASRAGVVLRQLTDEEKEEIGRAHV